MITIYKTTNMVNGKVYVGQRVSSKMKNYYGSGKLINQALKKHGKDCFIVDVIDTVLIDKADETETLWIKEFDCLVPRGYNICPKGGTTRGIRFRFTDEQIAYQKVAMNRLEVKAKIRAALKGKICGPQSDEHRANESAAQRIAQNRPEVKAKRNAAVKIAMNRPEVRAKMCTSHAGIKESAETRAKKSASRLGKKDSAETRAKKSAAHTGIKLSIEHRAKQSAAQLIVQSRSEVRAKKSASRTGVKRGPYKSKRK